MIFQDLSITWLLIIKINFFHQECFNKFHYETYSNKLIGFLSLIISNFYIYYQIKGIFFLIFIIFFFL